MAQSPGRAPSGSGPSNAHAVTVLLLLLVLLPLMALAVKYPESAGPPVAVFLLTGVAVFATRWWRGRKTGPNTRGQRIASRGADRRR